MTPEELAQQQLVQKEIMRRYQDASADNTDIKAAQDDAKRQAIISAIASAVDTFANAGARARGAAPMDTSALDTLNKAKQNAVAQAIQAKQAKLQGIVDQNNILNTAADNELARASLENNKANSIRQNELNQKNLDETIRSNKAKEANDAAEIAQKKQELELKKDEIERKKLTPGAAGVTDLGSPQSEGEAKAEGYYLRGKAALEGLDNLPIDRLRPDAQKYIDISKSARELPVGIGKLVETGLNIIGRSESNVLTPEEQQYQAYVEDFTDSVIRPKTGATIGSEEEAREKRKYFPQQGDDPATVEAKRELRRQALESLKISTGRVNSLPSYEIRKKDTPTKLHDKAKIEYKDIEPQSGGLLEQINKRVREGDRQSAVEHFIRSQRDPAYQKALKDDEEERARRGIV